MTGYQNDLRQPVGEPVPDWTPRERPARIVLQGLYARLEPISVDDHAEGLFEAFQEDKEGRIWTYLPEDPPSSLEEVRQWMTDTCLTNDPHFFTVIDKKDDKIGGFASYLRISPKVGSIEVGYINFTPRLQKTVAATETMFLMMQYAFDTLGYRRYEWKCDSLNAPSRTAALRLGFTYEGTFRQATMYKNRNRDTAWFSIIDKEWPCLRQAFTEWLTPGNFDNKGRQRQPLSFFIDKARDTTTD